MDSNVRAPRKGQEPADDERGRERGNGACPSIDRTTWTCNLWSGLHDRRASIDGPLRRGEAMVPSRGRLAQLVRAPRLHRGGRGFEPLTAHSYTFGQCDR